MERLEFNFGDWLNPRRGYIYGEIVDSEFFQTTPYTSITVHLIRLGDGYGYREGQWAVVEEWRQENDPEYSDCDEAGIIVFNSEQEARKHFEKRVEELFEEYPQ